MDRDDSNRFHGRSAESWMMAEVSQLQGLPRALVRWPGGDFWRFSLIPRIIRCACLFQVLAQTQCRCIQAVSLC